MGVKLKDGSTAWDCTVCNTQVVLTPDVEKRYRETGETFYCPKGHHLSFHPSKNDELKEEIESLTRDRDYWRNRFYDKVDESTHIARRLFSTQGVVTKMKSERAALKNRISDLSYANDHIRHELEETLGLLRSTKRQLAVAKGMITKSRGRSN